MQLQLNRRWLAGLCAACCLSVSTPVAAQAGSQEACKASAIAVITAAINSLRSHPDQMVSITVVGMQGVSNGGGTGLNAVANGGAGSGTTIGALGIASSDGAQVARNSAPNQAAMEQSKKTVEVLEQIRDAVSNGDHSKAEALLGPLKDVAVSVVAEVVKAAILAR